MSGPKRNLPDGRRTSLNMASSAAKEAAFTLCEVVPTTTAKEQVLPGTDFSDEDQAIAGLAGAGAQAGVGRPYAVFAGIFNQHGARMKSVAANLLGSFADAEDAVQDTFIKVHRSAATFRGQARVTTWIYRILLNTCYDQMRRSHRRAEDPLPPSLGVSAVDADHPLRLALEAELRRLPDQERSAFLLCEVEGFSHREVGEILDVPEATSRTFLFRAKRRLQQALRAGNEPAEIEEAT
jgi:RNA polymerase sigma-70 factor, ECF subfamily